MRRFLAVVLAYTFLLVSVAAQDPSKPQSQSEQSAPADQDEVVRITTNLVQIDAVVTDKHGKQINDLSTSDFQVLEDGRPQKVTNVTYVSTSNGLRPPVTRTPTGAIIPSPPGTIRPEHATRTLALVVDDLGLSFESIAYARNALTKFVNEQMRQGDLVAIVRTSAGAGALQQFTSDKRQLLSAIARIRWYPSGRRGISSFDPIKVDQLASLTPALPDGATQTSGGFSSDTGDASFQRQVYTIGTLGALRFVVQSMGEMPGRKSVLLISDGVQIFDPVRNNTSAAGANAGSTQAARQSRDEGSTGILESLRGLTDIANRSSVVIYTMDPKGLQTLGLTAQDDTKEQDSAQLEQSLAGRHQDFIESQSGMQYLAKQTGGFFVHDTNDLSAGVGEVMEDQKGYYLIGYRPDESTFDPTTGKRLFHSVTVSLSRPDLRVRSRTGFYGVTDEQVRKIAVTPEQRMLAALVSPFASGAVHLRLTSLFGSEQKTGAVVRSLLHIDGKDLTFTEEPDGWRRISFEILAVTFGDNGVDVDRYDSRDSLRVREDGYQAALKDGIIYTLNVPVKKPGAYQLRIAVRDLTSNNIGSANQFIEVPDLKKGSLALSGVAVAGWSQGPATTDNSASPVNVKTVAGGEPAAPTKGLVSDPQASPAVRRFHVGSTIEYAYAIYNAKLDSATHLPKLTTQVRLFRDGELVYESEPKPFDASQQHDLKQIPVVGGVELRDKVTPGEYFLQVVVTDQMAKRDRQIATEYIDFDLLP